MKYFPQQIFEAHLYPLKWSVKKKNKAGRWERRMIEGGINSILKVLGESLSDEMTLSREKLGSKPWGYPREGSATRRRKQHRERPQAVGVLGWRTLLGGLLSHARNILAPHSASLPRQFTPLGPAVSWSPLPLAGPQVLIFFFTQIGVVFTSSRTPSTHFLLFPFSVVSWQNP